tara:strand:- start:831 stop:2855 length:2025 start_codon:yes stop_codon:yes gene_type:complete
MSPGEKIMIDETNAAKNAGNINIATDIVNRLKDTQKSLSAMSDILKKETDIVGIDHTLYRMIHNSFIAGSTSFKDFIKAFNKHPRFIEYLRYQNASFHGQELAVINHGESREETEMEFCISAADELKEFQRGLFFFGKNYITSDEYLYVADYLLRPELVKSLEDKARNIFKNFSFASEELFMKKGHCNHQIKYSDYFSNDNVTNFLWGHDPYNESQTIDKMLCSNIQHDLNKKNVNTDGNNNLDETFSFLYKELFDYESNFNPYGEVDINKADGSTINILNKFCNMIEDYRSILDSYISDMEELQAIDDLNIKDITFDDSTKKFLKSSALFYSKLPAIIDIYNEFDNQFNKFELSFKEDDLRKSLEQIFDASPEVCEAKGLVWHPDDMYSPPELNKRDHDYMQETSKMYASDNLVKMIIEEYQRFVFAKFKQTVDGYKYIKLQFQTVLQEAKSLRRSIKGLTRKVQSKEERSKSIGDDRLEELLNSYRKIIKIRKDSSYHKVSDEVFNEWVVKIKNCHRELLEISDSELYIDGNIKIKGRILSPNKMSWDQYKTRVRELKLRTKTDYENLRNSGKYPWLLSRPETTYKGKGCPDDGIEVWNELLHRKKLKQDEYAPLILKYLDNHIDIPIDATINYEGEIIKIGTWYYRNQNEETKGIKEIKDKLKKNKEHNDV